ncbi:hypothetical protein PGIGA_G00191540 [Pangasianodon gigas]|uniref:Uncharacterized protein n=1 Tax=Pangasianodon gigas TaxID=30993 RepID=A0ACC5WCC1_PANGG|nr:hypothetical protein [Pangasianodon gigas]
MSLDWGRKPEYPEETPEGQGEHANSTHTGQRSGNPRRPPHSGSQLSSQLDATLITAGISTGRPGHTLSRRITQRLRLRASIGANAVPAFQHYSEVVCVARSRMQLW